MTMRRFVTVLALLSLAAAGLVLAGSAHAHNPALTHYEPAELDGDALVAGEVGTFALLDEDGEPRWEDNVSAHVTQAPVVNEDTAVLPSRAMPQDELQLLGVKPEGDTWTTPLDGDGVPWVAPTEDGFLALTTDGTLTTVDPDGQTLTQTNLPVGARQAPTLLPDGRHAVPTTNQSLALIDQEGTLHDELQLEGTPSTISATNETLYVATMQPGENATIQAYTHALDEAWTYELEGLRVGGELTIANQTLFAGTFDPHGASLAAFTLDGDPLWTKTFEEDTAAAATAAEDAVFAVTNTHAYALNATDGETLWKTELNPRLVSPSLIGDHVIPSGGQNEISALDRDTGEIAWTWSDGVDEVDWYGHGTSQDGDEDQDRGTPVPAASIVAALLLAALIPRRDR